MFTTTESGMIFGPYPEELVFQIEHSETQRKAGGGIRSVEFLYLQPENKLLFIEARSSSPRSDTDEARFEQFISEITEKFLHSFHMYTASKLGRYSEMDGKLRECSDADMKYKFILIINGHQDEWLLPIQDALRKRLIYHNKIWGSEVRVLNEEMASMLKLISAWSPKNKAQ